MSALSIKPTTRVSTTVLTYILNPNVNLGRFLTSIKNKIPKAVVAVRTDNKGYQNVSVTNTATADYCTNIGDCIAMSNSGSCYFMCTGNGARVPCLEFPDYLEENSCR